jgi:hypothetical protein
MMIGQANIRRKRVRRRNPWMREKYSWISDD